MKAAGKPVNARLQLRDNTDKVVVTYDLTGVLIGLLTHQLGSDGVMIEQVTLHYDDVAYTE